MKFIALFLFGMFVSGTYLNCANAESQPCPNGCFCLRDGQFDPNEDFGETDDQNVVKNRVEEIQKNCQNPTPILTENLLLYDQYNYDAPKPSNPGATCFNPGLMFIGGTNFSIVCDRGMYLNVYAKSDPFNYFLDEFSEFYYKEDTAGHHDRQYFGGYGVKDEEVVYFPGHLSKLFACPETYPLSDGGAKTVYECYKKEANGKKVYYTPKQPVDFNSDLSLKVQCSAGQYLPAKATRCQACDGLKELCFGGEYIVGLPIEQGRIQNKGYIPDNIDSFESCRPGYYMPANTDKCSPCVAKYACPGGIFYTDKKYSYDRGLVSCGEAKPNNNQTACSVLKENISINTDLGGGIGLVSSGQNTGLTTEEQAQLDLAKKMIAAGVSAVQPSSNTASTTNKKSSIGIVSVGNALSASPAKKQTTTTSTGLGIKGLGRVKK